LVIFSKAESRRVPTHLRSLIEAVAGREVEMISLYANLERWRPFLLSILRVVTALLFLQSGLSKFFGFPAAGPPLAGLIILAAIIEVIGSLLLLVGLYTRLAALVMSGEMAFAYFMAHAPKSFYPAVNGGTLAILYCFVFLYFVFAGGGPWSVDRVVLKQD
jgi:putative oxidoreductase